MLHNSKLRDENTTEHPVLPLSSPSVVPVLSHALSVALSPVLAMEELDGDEVRVSSRGRLAERDIVQVLPVILFNVRVKLELVSVNSSCMHFQEDDCCNSKHTLGTASYNIHHNTSLWWATDQAPCLAQGHNTMILVSLARTAQKYLSI